MKLSHMINKESLENTLDGHIDDVRRIMTDGITEGKDALVLDACLKYVILMSEIRER